MWVASKEEEKKRALREATLFRLRSLSKTECLLWSDLIQAKALQLPPYLASRSVALYSPIQNEVGTANILEHSLRQGRQVFYPKLGSDDALNLVQVLSAGELAAGQRGVLEPTGIQYLAETDHKGLLVVVPGVAFDRRGNRLGRGKGWYDRLLARLGREPTFVGLAYELQLVDRVPTEAGDRKVDYIVTEERLIDCGETSPLSCQIC
jgi:5-formyltetrahydrofolate cyclo-ligase